MANVQEEERQLRGEAVDWVQRLGSGRATLEDVEALKKWRARSPAHEAAFVAASRLWREFAPAARNLRERGEIAGLPALRPHRPAAFSRRAVLSGGLVAGAAAAAYAATYPPLGLWPSFVELTADYRTATGEQRELALSGDVSVHMNTQTSMALLPAEGDADRLQLIAGEASFRGLSRQQRPLVVFAADGAVTTQQSDFDIRRAGRSVCVTCVGGNVIVALESQRAALGPGQQIRYDDQGLSPIVTADVELVTAWRQGVLIFRKTPLSEVVDEINRYRSGHVILTARDLARKAISGRFRIAHMDEIFVRLNQAFGITSRSLPGGIVLLG